MSPRSVNTIARTLIQTVVRQKLNAIKSDPERSLRNLVDMGLSFAVGGEQKRFLQQAQHALQDENSAYYRIIYDMALHVDTEHLMGFGMNLGYNSLTAGARTIRRLESECGYDIPWCLTLAIDRKGYTAHESDYTSLIEQGKRLGIYTYLIIAPELPVGLFTLLHQQKDCAFLLFTSPDELTGDVIHGPALSCHAGGTLWRWRRRGLRCHAPPGNALLGIPALPFRGIRKHLQRRRCAGYRAISRAAHHLHILHRPGKGPIITLLPANHRRPQ